MLGASHPSTKHGGERSVRLGLKRRSEGLQLNGQNIVLSRQNLRVRVPFFP